MRLILTSLFVGGIFTSSAQAQDTNNAPAPTAVASPSTTNPAPETPAAPSLTPPPEQAPAITVPPPAALAAPTSTPAPASATAATPPPVPAPTPAAAPAPTPAPAVVTTPAPTPAPVAPAPTVVTTPAPVSTVAPAPKTSKATASSAGPAQTPTHAPHADRFRPEAIIDRCMDDVTLSDERFHRLFSGSVVEFVGTVAGINHEENLVVFRGGGVYPQNWDVQLKPHGQKFSVGHTYRVTFRLTHLRDEPLAGYSFRGIVLHRTSNN